jgi:[ribosomal protein S18]-alanine N-acetyltransferase
MIPPPFAAEWAGEEDVAALVLLETVCFSHPWTPENFLDAMAWPDRGGVLVLRTRAQAAIPRGLLAYCVLQTVADEMHVHNVAVRPEQRRLGLARRLLWLALAVGARRGARRAFLEVRVTNAAARRLYETMGFHEVGMRRAYYVHPTEDALVLRRDDLGVTQDCR